MTTDTKTTEKVATKTATNTASKSTGSAKLAVIKTGGKQYLVEEGQTIKIEKLPETARNAKGEVVFSEVLLISEGDKLSLGKPLVASAKVSAEVVEDGRDKKIDVIRFRSKSRYFKKRGHRQPFTKVKITKIA